MRTAGAKRINVVPEFHQNVRHIQFYIDRRWRENLSPTKADVQDVTETFMMRTLTECDTASDAEEEPGRSQDLSGFQLYRE